MRLIPIFSPWAAPLAAAVALALGACACAGSENESETNGDRLVVVATFSVLGDLVANVGGDRVELVTLVGPDGDAHTFEPTPADGARLAEADVVIENGIGFEVWLDDLYQASGSGATRVVASDGIVPATLVEEGVEEEDPHVWQDVANVEVVVERIRDALAEADPDGADAYRANAEAYLEELSELDAWIVDETSSLPADKRKLVTSHDAFGYFVRRYGFELVGTAIASFSTEAADPSAGEIADLVDEIRAAGVPAIFAENVENPDLVEGIADAAGVEVGEALYSDALGPEGSGAETYVQMMRHNVDAIVSALSG